ncbi:MAG: tetratricopeptide repeat protein, partial [Rhodothalassiaceae bacterium]
MASGQSKLAAGDYQAAIIEYKNAVQLSPTDAAARLALGRAYLTRYHVQAAEKELERAADLGAPANEVYPYLFRAWLLLGKPEDVIGRYESLDEAAAASPDIAVLYADALLAQGRIKDAAAALENLPGTDPGVLARRAQVAYAEEDRDQALAILAQALEADPDNMDANALMGQLKAIEGDREAARTFLARAHAADPFAPAVGLAYAGLAVDLKDLDTAMAVLDQLESNGITYIRATYLRSVIALEEQDFTNAKALAEKVLAANPRYVPAVLVAGIASSALGNDEVAVNYLQRFADDATPEVARRALAWSNLRLGRADAALKVLDAGDSTAWTPEQLRLATTAAVASRNYDRAVELLNGLSEREPDSISAKAALAALKLARGDRAGAEAILAEIDDPARVKSPEDKIRLALVLMRAGHLDRALALAEEVRALPDHAVQGATLAGMIALARKDDDKAIAAFEAAVEADPTDTGALRALAQLYVKA